MMFGDWFVLAVGITLFLHLLFYLFAKITRNAEHEARAKFELTQLIVGVGVVAVLINVFDILTAATLTSGEPPLHYVQNFLSRVISHSILPTYSQVVFASLLTKFQSIFSFRLQLKAWGYDFPAYSDLQLRSTLLNFLGMGFAALYTTMQIQVLTLSFIKVFAPRLFFIGVILYVFSYTRRAGAFLTMTALAFYWLLPTVMILLIHALDDTYMIEVGSPYIFNPFPLPHIFIDIALLPSFLGTLTFILFFAVMSQLSVIAYFIPSFALVAAIAFINAGVKVLLWE